MALSISEKIGLFGPRVGADPLKISRLLVMNGPRPQLDPQIDANGLLLLQGFGMLGFVALLGLGVWNLTDPMPPAWDEAQHLLMAQDFATHLGRMGGDPDGWRVFSHLSQRYPPLTYWLSLLYRSGSVFDRSAAQVLNLLLLGVTVLGTYKLGALLSGRGVGILAGCLLLLYPAVQGLAHVYMLDLPLTAMVSLAYWGALGYWIRPSWRGSLGLGGAVGLVLLTKWNGILFLGVPLLAVLGKKSSWGGLQKLLIIATAGILCWPWYGPNWLFVLSNGLQYGSTTHYYVRCPVGSWCWWTTYLGWLPQQMSAVLCGVPLLALGQWLWGRPRALHPDRERTSQSRFTAGLISRAELAWLLLTFGGGYVLYTLIGIKDPRFTVPLLPLLAVMSAVGLWQLHHSQTWVRGILTMGVLALLWGWQPLTPGSVSLAKSLGSASVEVQLRSWIQTQPPGLVGVIPNTELLSPETLTYLARVENVPTTFFPAGQVEAVEWEQTLADGYVTALSDPAHWGITGPFLQRKQALAQALEQSEQWLAEDAVTVPQVGILQTYRPQDPPQDPAGWRLEMLDPMAVALITGEFEVFSRLLSAWTVLRTQPTLLDPELNRQRLTLEQTLTALSERQASIQEMVKVNYQLAILALARLDTVSAQQHFDRAATLDPDNSWHAGYGALMRFLFTYDLPNWPQSLQDLLQPLQENNLLCGQGSEQLDYCQQLKNWGLFEE